MGAGRLRILLLADTHLGFDLPARPRVDRRRRGDDFFEQYEAALAPARRGEVDLVVHGGDVFHRPRVRASVVERALRPLRELAAAGLTVALVPGNHERSQLPCPLLGRHPNLLVFDRPTTFVRPIAGLDVALAGFPFQRRSPAFASALAATAWSREPADVRLLCVHQAVEGARVGAHDFTFRRGPDVIAGRALPAGFVAVLAGHIHRGQVLTHDLAGRPLAAPVYYPGATARTSIAERFEIKGYRLLAVDGGGRVVSDRFVALATRPMVDLELDVAGCGRAELAAEIGRRLAALDPDAVVRIRLAGTPRADGWEALRAASLRALAPSAMNVEVARSTWRCRRRSLNPAPARL